MKKARIYAVAVTLFAAMLSVLGLWWATRSEDSMNAILNAQEMLKTVCEGFVKEDFDETGILTVEGRGTMETHTEFSGNDTKHYITGYQLDGSLVSRFEFIIKDNVEYRRHSISDIAPETLTEWIVHRVGTASGYRMPCYGPGSGPISGQGVSGAISSSGSERYFTWNVDAYQSELVGKQEIWVDQSGRTLRTKLTIPSPEETAMSVPATGDDSFPREVYSGVFSGWGEPNIIVAPVTGTLHETFITAGASGSAVGFVGGAGSLEPSGFTTADGTAAEIRELKWQDGAVSLALAPHDLLTGYVLDFFDVEGEVSLSLDTASAASNATAGTLSWPVSAAPWADGDYLMLRIRETGSQPILPLKHVPAPESPNSPANPAPTATPFPTPAHAATPAPTATTFQDIPPGLGDLS